jgi:hypothetical protein
MLTNKQAICVGRLPRGVRIESEHGIRVDVFDERSGRKGKRDGRSIKQDVEGGCFSFLIFESPYVLESQSEPKVINSSRRSNNSGGLGAALSIRRVIVRKNSIVWAQCRSDIWRVNTGKELMY